MDEVGELRSVIMEEKVMDVLIRCGFNKSIYNVALSKMIALQHVILDCLGELIQFKDGLNSLGVGEALVDYQVLMRPFYCTDSKERLEQVCKFNVHCTTVTVKPLNSRHTGGRTLVRCREVDPISAVD